MPRREAVLEKVKAERLEGEDLAGGGRPGGRVPRGRVERPRTLQGEEVEVDVEPMALTSVSSATAFSI